MTFPWNENDIYIFKRCWMFYGTILLPSTFGNAHKITENELAARTSMRFSTMATRWQWGKQLITISCFCPFSNTYNTLSILACNTIYRIFLCVYIFQKQALNCVPKRIVLSLCMIVLHLFRLMATRGKWIFIKFHNILNKRQPIFATFLLSHAYIQQTKALYSSSRKHFPLYLNEEILWFESSFCVTSFCTCCNQSFSWISPMLMV